MFVPNLATGLSATVAGHTLAKMANEPDEVKRFPPPPLGKPMVSVGVACRSIGIAWFPLCLRGWLLFSETISETTSETRKRGTASFFPRSPMSQ